MGSKRKLVCPCHRAYSVPVGRERRIIVDELRSGMLPIAGDAAQHLGRSLRLRVGDEVVLTDGRGKEAKAV